MKVKTPKPDSNILGQFNAWVADGATREEAYRRLNESPEELREDIISHVKTAFMMRRAK